MEVYVLSLEDVEQEALRVLSTWTINLNLCNWHYLQSQQTHSKLICSFPSHTCRTEAFINASRWYWKYYNIISRIALQTVSHPLWCFGAQCGISYSHKALTSIQGVLLTTSQAHNHSSIHAHFFVLHNYAQYDGSQQACGRKL